MAYELTTCVVSLAGIMVIWFGPMARLSRDNLRSDIRRIRDNVFDFMWKNGYSYDDESYRKTRQLLNGILRLSNTATPLVFMLSLRNARASSRSEIILNDCDSKLRDVLEKATHDATKRFIIFLFLEGTAGLWFRFILHVFPKLAGTNKANEWYANKERAIIVDAYKIGEPVPSMVYRLQLHVQTNKFTSLL